MNKYQAKKTQQGDDMSVQTNTVLVRLKRLMYVLLALLVFVSAILLYMLIALSLWIIDGKCSYEHSNKTSRRVNEPNLSIPK